MIPLVTEKRHTDGTLETVMPPATRRDRLGPEHVRRSYGVELTVVDSTDNYGDLCEYCGEEPNNATTYFTDMDGDQHCRDSCIRCALTCVDTEWDVDNRWTVLVEVVW